MAGKEKFHCLLEGCFQDSVRVYTIDPIEWKVGPYVGVIVFGDWLESLEQGADGSLTRRVPSWFRYKAEVFRPEGRFEFLRTLDKTGKCQPPGNVITFEIEADQVTKRPTVKASRHCELNGLLVANYSAFSRIQSPRTLTTDDGRMYVNPIWRDLPDHPYEFADCMAKQYGSEWYCHIKEVCDDAQNLCSKIEILR